MTNTLTPSFEASLRCALSIVSKLEKNAKENLLLGDTDKVQLLVNVRQLSNLLNNIRNGRSEETT